MFCVLFNALIRDGFRCVISGQPTKELELELKRNADASVCYSECAHIFPDVDQSKRCGQLGMLFSYLPRCLIYMYPHLDVAS